MLSQAVDEDSELISLYYGEEVREEDAQRFTEEVESLYPDVDMLMHIWRPADLLLCAGG